MQTTNTSSDLLIRAGTVLYGERWAGPLSEEIDVEPRTIRRWISGKAPVPEGVWKEIAELLELKSVLSSTLAEQIADMDFLG